MSDRDEGYRAPLLWLLVPYVAGLALAPHMSGLREHPLTSLTIAAGIAVVACVAALRSAWPARILWAGCTVAGALLFGLLRQAPNRAPPARWESLPPRETTLEVRIERVFAPNSERGTQSAIATVMDAPEPYADLGGTRVFLSHLAVGGDGPLIRSQRLRVAGVFESIHFDPATIGRAPPPGAGAHSFREYLLANAVAFRLWRCRLLETTGAPSAWHRWHAALGARFARILSAGLPPEHTATGAYLAMYLGRKDALSPEQRLDYLHTGAMHLFAISGLHIAAIAACMHGVLRLVRMPDLLRAAIGIAALVAFVEATGGTPSARRALLMVALVWTGYALRKPANPVASIATAALAVLVIDPLALRSVSFQFSYSVVAMLLLYGAPLTNRLLARWHPWAHIPDPAWRWWHRAIFFGGRRVIILACTSWSAALVSTPLTVAYFGIATPGAVLANLVLVPVALHTITAGFASLACGLLGVTVLSVVFNHAAAMILTAMNAFAHAAARWPGMYVSGDFAADWMAPALVTGTLALCLIGYAVRWSRIPGGLALPPVALIGALLFLVTPAADHEQSTGMKSAYELAMERLQRSEQTTERPLTPEQKERLAEITRIYQGRIAEREIFLRQRLDETQARGELEEVEKLRRQMASERARLEEDRDAEKERVRRGDAGQA